MQSKLSAPIIPVVLAGGKGTRLWPLSTPHKPKQFLALDGKETLLEKTLKRCELLDSNNTLIIGNSDQRFLLGEQVKRAETKSHIDILVEPFGRDSALPLALAALYSLQQDQDPILCVMPADAAVFDIKKWKDTLDRAVQSALLGHVTVVGLKPTRPETGYGYIEAGAELKGGTETFLVSSFKEKPNQTLAEEFVTKENYLWNSGMFVVQASVLRDAFKKYAPKTLKAAQEALSESHTDLDFIRLGESGFKKAPAISFDYAVMEHVDNAAVVKADFGWTDLGSWKAVKDLSVGDRAGNIIDGPGCVHNGKNNYLKSEDRVIAVNGLDNIGVIVNKTGVLISSLDEIHNIKDLVKSVEDSGFHEEVGLVFRPWGSYESLLMMDGYQVKRINVNPQNRLSLQKHKYRSEHWVVVSGTAVVTIDDGVFTLEEGHSCDIPLGAVHRLENPSVDVPLTILEVQRGSYLGEDDIIRLEDDFNRS